MNFFFFNHLPEAGLYGIDLDSLFCLAFFHIPYSTRSLDYFALHPFCHIAVC